MTKLSPIESEFDSTEEAEAYDRWFREKVEKALAGEEAAVAHHEVMAAARRIIDEKQGDASRLAP